MFQEATMDSENLILMTKLSSSSRFLVNLTVANNSINLNYQNVGVID
jgi:hypothetical protein